MTGGPQHRCGRSNVGGGGLARVGREGKGRDDVGDGGEERGEGVGGVGVARRGSGARGRV